MLKSESVRMMAGVEMRTKFEFPNLQIAAKYSVRRTKERKAWLTAFECLGKNSIISAFMGSI